MDGEGETVDAGNAAIDAANSAIDAAAIDAANSPGLSLGGTPSTVNVGQGLQGIGQVALGLLGLASQTPQGIIGGSASINTGIANISSSGIANGPAPGPAPEGSASGDASSSITDVAPSTLAPATQKSDAEFFPPFVSRETTGSQIQPMILGEVSGTSPKSSAPSIWEIGAFSTVLILAAYGII